MFHHVARASDRRLLFTTWDEGAALWHVVLRVAPRPVALCLMPNHLHLLCDSDLRAPLGRALGGFARSWNHKRGRCGPLFEALPKAEEVRGTVKRRRVQRYILLNPCRAGLVTHPLDWPLSTYLDDLGLTLPSARRPVRDRLAHHAYVCRDERVAWRELRVAETGVAAPMGVLQAVSAVTRTPLDGLGSARGAARQLALRSLRGLAGLTAREAAAWLQVSESTAERANSSAGTAIVARLAWDAHCAGLDDRHLRRALQRSCYRNHRDAPAQTWVSPVE